MWDTHNDIIKNKFKKQSTEKYPKYFLSIERTEVRKNEKFFCQKKVRRSKISMKFINKERNLIQYKSDSI